MKETLFLILITLIIYYIIKNKKKRNNNLNYKEIYIKKESILTNNELKFYQLLKEITNKLDLIIFTQVALNRLIDAKDKNSFYKICNKTIDYVITDKKGKIKLCIELDDSTHNRPDRIRRDIFINNLFESIGIKLLRIPLKNCYNINLIEQKIKEAL